MRQPHAQATSSTGSRRNPDADALLTAEHADPFSILGPHRAGDDWIVRVLAPGADAARIEDQAGQVTDLVRTHPGGLFEVVLQHDPGRYRVHAVGGGAQWSFIDPYQFGPILGALDEHLISEGTHTRLWRTLGAHPRSHGGTDGVTFAVWAPSARRVSVVGDFNDWDGRRHVMRKRGSGVWEIFVPEIGAGMRYKFEIAPAGSGLPQAKSDPVGFQGDLRPDNCSVVQALDGFDWRDDAWMRARGGRQSTDAPISIYEAHLGSWRRREDGSWMTYRDLADTLVPYVKSMGFTHIECLPVSEHPFDGSWGYQPVGLYAPTSRFGDLDDFRAFVDACHAADLGLILDWVPAHFPTDAHGLSQFDGTALYEHADPREGFHPDWNTLIFNLGRREVGNFLTANAQYWMSEHHVDALRVDAVASMLYRDYSRKDGEWIPNRHGGRENLESVDFLRDLNRTVYGAHPGAMVIAEESTAWPGVSRPVHDGGLGFGFKWNMGWMHDTLEYMKQDPMHRAHHHDKLSFGLSYAFSENFVLSLSHDEVVHGKGSLFGKMPGDAGTKLANLRAYYAFMWAHPGKKLLFMGQEFGQRGEWDADGQLDWAALDDAGHAGLRALVADLNSLYRDKPALHARDCEAGGFEWIDGSAREANVLSWLRHGPKGSAPVMAVLNFSGVEHVRWRFGVPNGGTWRVALNTDAERYGGTGRGTTAKVTAEPVPFHGQGHSIELTLPPLSGLYLMPEEE